MRVAPAAVAVLVALLAGCVSSSSKRSAPPASTTATTATAARPPSPPPSPGSPPAPGGLQAEAGSAATGDIPDNQVFLVFRNGAAGYSMKYPEGWAQFGSGRTVTFHDKNNIVRVVITNGSVSIASIQREVKTLKGAHVSRQPQALMIGGAPAVKVVYTTQSAPNAVTGKRVTLAVDRYYLGHPGKEAIVDLGTPIGVDNVDAYRMMINSFRWR